MIENGLFLKNSNCIFKPFSIENTEKWWFSIENGYLDEMFFEQKSDFEQFFPFKYRVFVEDFITFHFRIRIFQICPNTRWRSRSKSVIFDWKSNFEQFFFRIFAGDSITFLVWNSDFKPKTSVSTGKFPENIGKTSQKHGNLLRNNKNGSSYESLPCPPSSPCHYRPHRAEMNNLNGRLIKPKAIFIAKIALFRNRGHNCIFTWIILEIIHFFLHFCPRLCSIGEVYKQH